MTTRPWYGIEGKSPKSKAATAEAVLRRETSMKSNYEAIGRTAATSSTLADFCARHSISKTLWQKLQKSGRGPKYYRLGRQTIRISAEAEAAWLRAREEPNKAEAAMMAAAVEGLKKQSRKAAANSLASPKHYSRVKVRAKRQTAKSKAKV